MRAMPASMTASREIRDLGHAGRGVAGPGENPEPALDHQRAAGRRPQAPARPVSGVAEVAIPAC